MGVGQEPASMDTFLELINAEYRVNPKRELIIKADSSVPYGKVREVTDLLAKNHFTGIKLAAGKAKD